MRLCECKENMFSFAEREHSRSYHAAKIQNVFDMVVSLQPFLIQFTRFSSDYKNIQRTGKTSLQMFVFSFFDGSHI